MRQDEAFVIPKLYSNQSVSLLISQTRTISQLGRSYTKYHRSSNRYIFAKQNRVAFVSIEIRKLLQFQLITIETKSEIDPHPTVKSNRVVY